MPDLTNEQIRDRLAEIAGYIKDQQGAWVHRDLPNPPIMIEGFSFWPPDAGHPEHRHPIPPLDSPEALGVVAGMLPKGWAWDRIEFWQDVLEVEAWSCHPEKICVVGRSPTETIARSIAVIASHEAEGAKPC